MLGQRSRVILRRACLWFGLLCLGFGTWRSFPVVERSPQARAPLHVVLFDVSAGTTRLHPAYGLWARAQLKREVQRAQEVGAEVAVGLYGSELRDLGLGTADEWLGRLEGRGGRVLRLGASPGGDQASNLDGGLALFETALTDLSRSSAHLVVCGRRDYTGFDPRASLERLAQAGVSFDWVDAPPTRRPDLAIEALDLPAEPAPGEPLMAEFELALAGASVARDDWQLKLAIELEHSTGVESMAWHLEIPAGGPDEDGILRWRIRHELGTTRNGRTALTARVMMSRTDGTVGDACPENDYYAAQCRSGRVRLITAVAREERHGDLLAWLGRDPARWPGLQWRIVTPAQLPESLGEVDLVVSFDLGPNELPAQLMEAYVKGGGGWFFCGGWGSLNGWFKDSQQFSPLADLLPLSPAPQGGTPRDVIFLVDGSGSMAEGPFERVRQALLGLVPSVSPEDHLYLRFFTATLGKTLDLSVANRDPLVVLQELMDSEVPGGATSIFYSLELLLEERQSSERDCLVFLLTDGNDSDSFETDRRGPLIAQGFSRGESRLIPIAIGKKPNRWVLSQLLAEGQDLVDEAHMPDMSEYLLSEVFERRQRKGDLQVTATVQGKLEGTKNLLAAWDSNGLPWPNLEGFLRCDADANSDVLLRARKTGEPLLAWQRVGAGRVAAWASAPMAGWGAGYQNADSFMAPLLRILAASPVQNGELSLVLEANELKLRNVPKLWPAKVETTIYAQVANVGLTRFPVGLELGKTDLWIRAQGLGADPLTVRQGPSPADLDRRLSHGAPMHAIFRDPLDGTLLGQSGFYAPCSEEFRYKGRSRLAPEPRAESPRARPVLSPRADPLAWIWIAVGCCLLSLTALLRSPKVV